MISRINSPHQVGRMNQPVVAKAEGDWWLAGGIDPADCFVAWQPLRAASAMDSLVSVHGERTLGSGKYSLQSLWEADKGWRSDGTYGTEYAIPEVAGFSGKSNTVCSWIVKIANPVKSADAIRPVFMLRYNNVWAWLWMEQTTGYVSFNNGGTEYLHSSEMVSGVYAMGGITCYIDGAIVGSINSSTYGSSVNWDTIGGGYAGRTRYFGEIHAIAFYTIGLTAKQVMAITNAMNQL